MIAATIWKFQFDIGDQFTLWIPIRAKIIHVGMQGLYPYIWAIVNPEAQNTKRIFRVYGTGEPIIDIEDWKHVGTFSMHDGAYIWHLFEQKS